MVKVKDVGAHYYASEACDETIVERADCDIRIRENLWEAEDNFDTEYKWSTTVELQIPKSCESMSDVMRQSLATVSILNALKEVGYEFSSMQEEGVATFDRPAPATLIQ